MAIGGAAYNSLMTSVEQRGAGFLLLIDPDRGEAADHLKLAEAAHGCGVDAILVGTSLSLDGGFHQRVRAIKTAAGVPVILFPGSAAQISPDVDAILFTSLLSGRNPALLIDEQVKGAPLVKRFGLEAIPTGYLLIDSGNRTSVQYMSNSQPIPRHKYDIACAHALAAQYLGMHMVYLEAGSGAAEAVPVEMVAAVSSYVDVPVIVGGGLREPRDCADRIEAGASFVVVGTGLENRPDPGHLAELAAATHLKETVRV